MAKNFWKLSGFSLFSIDYAYIDHKSYLAETLFVQRQIRVKLNCRMARQDSPYHVVFCSVHRDDRKKFEGAMEKLKDNMLLCGHTDYDEICEFFTDLIENDGDGNAVSPAP